jgi:DNA polymerase/3'-5' exonuclease PolX
MGKQRRRKINFDVTITAKGTLARSKGLKLSAAEGVVDQDGFGKILAGRTEESIFAALGLAFVEPKDREVKF